jgi:hypothetical protein
MHRIGALADLAAKTLKEKIRNIRFVVHNQDVIRHGIRTPFLG